MQSFFPLFSVVHQLVWTSSITLWEISQMMKWCPFQTGKTPVWAHVHTQQAEQTQGKRTSKHGHAVSVTAGTVSANIQKLQPHCCSMKLKAQFYFKSKKKWGIFKACSFSLSSYFWFVFSEFQVSEVFDVPSVLVNRWQADPHGLQFTEVHSGDELWRDHQDAHQRTCTGEKDITNPGVTLAANFYHYNSLIFFGLFCGFMTLVYDSGSQRR